MAFLSHDLNNITLVCFVLHWLYLDYHFVCAYFLVTCMLVNIVVWLINSVFNFLSHGVIFFNVNQISTHGWKVYSHFLQYYVLCSVWHLNKSQDHRIFFKIEFDKFNITMYKVKKIELGNDADPVVWEWWHAFYSHV